LYVGGEGKCKNAANKREKTIIKMIRAPQTATLTRDRRMKEYRKRKINCSSRGIVKNKTRQTKATLLFAFLSPCFDKNESNEKSVFSAKLSC